VTDRLRASLLWLPAAGWAAFIFVLSSQPVLPSPASVGDKEAHAFTYGVLAFLCLVGLTGARWRGTTRRRVAIAFLLAVLYGISDEFHQSFVPGRTPDVLDLAADAAGAALVLAACWGWAILLDSRASASRS
jgi:VanZ family protein